MARDNAAAKINAFLRSQGSPLAGYGRRIVSAGRKYGVDPMLVVAISGAETSFGTYAPARRIKNAWGWGPHIKFRSWGEAIDTVTRGLATGYIGEGRTTIPQIAQKWAPIGAGNDPTNLNSNWVKNVSHYYGQLTGSTVPVSQPGAPGASVMAPTSPLPAQATTPDLAGAAMQNLSDIAAGKFNANQALGNLTSSVLEQSQQQAPDLTPTDAPARAPKGTKVELPSGGKGQLHELFYDPEGGYDEGHQIGAIGGHSNHVHAAFKSPGALRQAATMAKKLGLRVGENPAYDKVDPVHVKGSYHYQDFPGTKIGMAIDVSGPPDAMRFFYRWALGRWG